jgi:DNA transposition AAA+ family ATPase
MVLQKPIVLLELRGSRQEFSFEDAFALLSDLETNLPTHNPSAISELRTQSEQPLTELQETIRQALESARDRRVPHFNING